MRALYSILLFSITLSISTFGQTLPDNIDISISPNGVIDLPNNVNAAWANGGIVKYTKIQAPNGKAIHFVAQNLLTEAQIVRCRNLLQFYLTNISGSQYGNDKSAVIDRMADNGAILLILNGADGDSNPPNLPGQHLYQNEIQVEGGNWYINNNYEHRDAAFEEILHMMHDYGIGVDGPNSQPGVLPAFQAEIRAAQDNADNNFVIWPIGESLNGGWYAELAQENSLSQEYLASVVDSYYGLWGPWTESPGFGMWGLYIAQTRSEIETEDPMGYALMPKYFAPNININMDIAPSFSGIFNMSFSPSEPYTHKSQYLQHTTLTGTNPSGIKGNDLYNRLVGNSVANILEGGKGNDLLDGKDGEDTAIFAGNASEYTISHSAPYTLVIDQTNERDGIDSLVNIELLKFADQTVTTTVNTEDTDELLDIEIYPNPCSSFMVIDRTNFRNSLSLKILDTKGMVLLEKRLAQNSGSKIKIDTDIFPKGILLVSLTSNKKTKTVLVTNK